MAANFSLRRSENSLLDGLGNWLSTPAESLACQPRGSSSTGSEIAKFPAISLLSREFECRDGFARDYPLSQTNQLILLNFYILGRGPKKARFRGLCGLRQLQRCRRD